MEKKTIGGFISALRKANGMTQKDLAERLNVSDKTVSRWERDEGVPDLSLIPVIAEIFEVSCDELLRGERRSPDERAEIAEGADTPKQTQKGIKERKRILSGSLSRYRNQTCIAMGIAVLGLIAALICNNFFPYDAPAFLIGAVFYVAAVVCQIIFMNNAFSSVSVDSFIFMNQAFYSVSGEEFEKEDLQQFRYRVVMLAEKSYGFILTLAAFSLPLIFQTYDTILIAGQGIYSWVLLGALFAAILFLIYVVVLYFVNASFIKIEFCSPGEKAEPAYWQNHRLKLRIGILLAVLFAVTVIVHSGVRSMGEDVTVFVSGTEFNDYDSFTGYMEQESSAGNAQFNTSVSQENVANGVEEIAADNTGDTTENTTENTTDSNTDDSIDDDTKADTSASAYQVVDADGNVLCEYIWRNLSVVQISYSDSSDLLPITVYTNEDITEAYSIRRMIHIGFCGIYVLEVLIAFVIYRKKRQQYA